MSIKESATVYGFAAGVAILGLFTVALKLLTVIFVLIMIIQDVVPWQWFVILSFVMSVASVLLHLFIWGRAPSRSAHIASTLATIIKTAFFAHLLFATTLILSPRYLAIGLVLVLFALQLIESRSSRNDIEQKIEAAKGTEPKKKASKK